jgi:hypothetical protein
VLIFRFGLPSALTHNFAGLAATWAGAELLVKLGSGIRLKPFFTTETFLETMLVLHLQCSPDAVESTSSMANDFSDRVSKCLKHSFFDDVK